MNRQKHKLSRRILAVLLMAAMLITMLPSAMFAAPNGDSGQETIFTDKEDASEATGVTANKILTDNQDGTYTINLSVKGFSNSSSETQNLPADIVLVVDTSTSMDESVGRCQSTDFIKETREGYFGRVYTVFVCQECGEEHEQDWEPKLCNAWLNRLDVAKSAAKSFVTGLFDASDDVKIGLYDF